MLDPRGINSEKEELERCRQWNWSSWWAYDAIHSGYKN